MSRVYPNGSNNIAVYIYKCQCLKYVYIVVKRFWRPPTTWSKAVAESQNIKAVAESHEGESLVAVAQM